MVCVNCIEYDSMSSCAGEKKSFKDASPHTSS